MWDVAEGVAGDGEDRRDRTVTVKADDHQLSDGELTQYYYIANLQERRYTYFT